IQRRPHDEKVRLNLTAQAQGTTIRPSSFPLPIRITDGALRWSPGSADFTGSVHVLGGHADLNCEVRGVRNGSGASVRLQAHAANLNPHSADRQVLRSFLGLPSGVEHLQWNSAGPWELELHQSPSAPTPNILLAGSLADSVLTWEPTDLLSTLQQGRFHFAQGPRHRTAVMTGVEGDVQGGYLASSLNMFGPHENPAGDFLGWSTGIPIGPEMVALAQQWVQEDGSKKSTHAPSTGIQFDGHIGFHMRAPIGSQQDETDGLSGTLTLAPLLMLEQGVLGSSAGRLEGDVEISPRGLSQGNFSFHSPGGDFQINDLHASRMESGLTAHGTLKSSKGVELTTRATQLLFPSAFEAFESLGLKGRLGCEN
ncbi:MAG: hypothetical protein MK213_06580, partial [Planctomycetes bacterium]|nr:hypothetical protein [Planctomycetota bacterium]